MTSAVPISATFTPARQRLPRTISAFVAACLAPAGLTAQPAQAADTGKISGLKAGFYKFEVAGVAGPNTTDTDGIYRKTVRIGDRCKFFIAQPAGGAKWYGNTYSEATATEVSASAYGQLFDLTIQLDPAPAPVAPKTLKIKKVSINGTAKVGKKLRASTSAWGPAPVRKSVKWYRNGRTISGQKNSTYTLRKADIGKRITVRVTQTKAGYKSLSKLSSKTKKVKKK